MSESKSICEDYLFDSATIRIMKITYEYHHYHCYVKFEANSELELEMTVKWSECIDINSDCIHLCDGIEELDKLNKMLKHAYTKAFEGIFINAEASSGC